jgi:PPP family 3-phenylpropionic acid transporter
VSSSYKALPYWRLSGFYFFYFSSLGALIPYWSLYLSHLGFNAQAIGELTAVIMVTRIIAPNIWGWLAERTEQPLTFVRLGAFLTIVSFLGIFVKQEYFWLILITGAFSFFWNSTLPLVESMTFAYLGIDSHRYSHIRLWGSIGFIVIAIGLGIFFERHSFATFPHFLIASFICTWVISLFIPKITLEYTSTSIQTFSQILRRPKVIALFVAGFLMQMSHAPYYTLYSLYLELHHYKANTIGQLWALGVIAEICAFLLMHRLLLRFNLTTLFMASTILTSLRWLFMAYFVDYFAVIVFAQLLHAVSFGVYHVVAMHFIYQYFQGRLQGRGQALYGSISFGVGGSIGSLMSGYTWENIGEGNSFLFAAFFALCATGIIWRWMYVPDAKSK